MSANIDFGNAPTKYNFRYDLEFDTEDYDIQIEYCVSYPSYAEFEENIIKCPKIVIVHALAVNDDGEWPILDFTDLLEYAGKTDEEMYSILVDHSADKALRDFEQNQEY